MTKLDLRVELLPPLEAALQQEAQGCKALALQVTIDLGDDFVPTCMAHPDTYLNKVVVGSQQGSMQLWNFIKGTRLYDFSVADCAIKCLAPSPALDVIGIGMADG